MKRFDVNETTAYVYNSKGGSTELPPDGNKIVELMGQVTDGPLKFINSTFTSVLKRDVQGVYIGFDSTGKVVWITAASESVRLAVVALEEALVRLREAQKKEES